MLNNLQLDIHYTFKQVKRLEVALTHSSFVNESPERGEHNERLEFLGDAVLELCISEILFCAFPQAREGELTSMRSTLVSQPSLAGLARSFKLDQYLLLGRGEEAQGGRKRDALLSDALEALLGAVFIDGSFAQVKAVVEILFASLLQRLQSERDNARSGVAGVVGSSDGNGGMSGTGPGAMNVAGKGAGSWAGNRDKDAKSRLQEMTQRLYQERPVYHLVGSDGPEHVKFFRVSLTLPDGRLFEAAGSSLKRAEQAVAAKALAELEG